ncbi:hypothetical protein F442_14616 [Phytophthora nicotianae P10297]|uniref:Uncharacterized protein n=1 Tax=Phytophthora nicotianae P10297 TaxID=1317064 RepID=W2YRJ4_PHYNI|nr:hypothetical protein F442_14616 [Phytophthora nicotianae P10297]
MVTMQPRNITRRVLRSDTAPERQHLDGIRISAENRRIDRLEASLEEVRDEIRAISSNVNATVNIMGASISAEIADIKQSVAGLVQSTANLVAGLTQVQQVAHEAERVARATTAPPPFRGGLFTTPSGSTTSTPTPPSRPPASG